MHWIRRHDRGRPPHPDVLTPAEWRVLELARAGHSNPEIATRLGIALPTVKTHMTRILAKLELPNRTALTTWKGRPATTTPSPSRRFLIAPIGWLSGKAAGIAVAAALIVTVGGFVVAMESGAIRGGGEDPAPPAATPVPTEPSSMPDAPRIVTLAELDAPAGRILHECSGTQWCVVATDGSGNVPLDGLPPATFLTPSPGGEFVAYYEHADGQRWLGVARMDGSEARRLAEARPVHDPVPPVWSPDGATIYVEQGPPPGTDGMGGDIDIVAVSVATGEARLLVDTDWFDGGPQVSPDGSMVVYIHQNPAAGGGISIRVIPAAGGEPLDLTGDPTINSSPTWLSDHRIMFVGWREGNAGSYNLYTIAADGSDLSAFLVVDDPATDIVFPVGHFAPAVSPDREWVAFQSDRNGALELYIARTDGSEVRQITTGSDGTAGIPTWSPDSAFLVYTSTMTGKQGIWISRIADAATAYLDAGGWPVWLR